MIDAIAFFDYIAMGPQGELVNRLTNGQAMLDYRVKLAFDDDPRFIRLSATKSSAPGSAAFVQLIPTTAISCITIGADEPKPSGKKS